MAEEVMELGFAVDVVEAMEANGRWPDLTRLQSRRPDVIRAAAWMLGHDVPVRDICKALSLSPCTVQAIGEQCGESVVTQKGRLTARMKLAFRLGIEAQIDLARRGKLTMFDLKLLHDMIQLAEGGVTSRTEHVHTHEEREALDYFQQLSRGMVIEGTEISAMSPAPAGLAIEATANALEIPANARHGDIQAPACEAEALVTKGMEGTPPETLHKHTPPTGFSSPSAADQTQLERAGGEGVEAEARS